MTSTTINAKTVDLGDLELGDKLYALVELEVMDVGTKRNGKAGTVDYRKVVIQQALRLAGALPGELATELRRQTREAEEAETGLAVFPGLEGILDGSGVVVTEADKGDDERVSPIGAPELERDELDAVGRWLALGAEVHALRGEVADGDKTAQARLDVLFSELNTLLPDDELVESEAGDLVVDAEGNARDVLELPDFEVEASEVVVELPATGEEPWAGYNDLTVPQITDHVDEYVEADKALGGPSAAALEYVARALVYERANGARAGAVKVLERYVAEVSDAVGKLAVEKAAPAGGAPVESPTEAPWPSFDKDTADTIIAHLKAVAEREGDDTARPLVEAARTYEEAHKKRKGVLQRLGGIVPPPLPRTEEAELDAGDDLLDALDGIEDDAHDDDAGPE